MRDVFVVGVGITKFGVLWDKSLRDLAVEASLKAIEDAKVDKIDTIIIGNYSSGTFIEQEHLAPLIADYLGLNPIPAIKVENACASGGVAFKTGFLEIASGNSDIVLVVGVEKMTDLLTSRASYSLSLACDREFEGINGITFPGLFALIARRYMYEFGLTRKQLSLVPVKNHKNASKNPNAQFNNIITLEDVENSPLVADPLRLYDCSPVSDGAAAVILASSNLISKDTNPIKISGIGQASDTMALYQRDSLVEFKATIEAAKKAYKIANKKPEDIDVIEVHDCFSIAEICAIEDLGFFPKGKGGEAIEAGLTDIDGKYPVNTTGGLKGKGHPVGATGIAQIVTIVEQLRGGAGENQIKNPRVGLAHNIGGSGSTAIVSILEVI